VVLTGTVEKEDNHFVSTCVELGVASCGDSVEEALDNLGDALKVHLNALEELGIIDQVFSEKGIEVKRDTSLSVKVSVSVPPGKTFRAYTREVALASAMGYAD